MEDQE